MHDSPLNNLIKEYYPEILKYCVFKLGHDYHGAEDCTQEVFFVLQKKYRSIDLSRDVRPWLYATADRIIHHYRRKNPESIDIDTLPEETEDFPYPDSILDVLNDEDRRLIVAYISGADKIKLAKQYHLSLAALYKRIARIKAKLRTNSD